MSREAMALALDALEHHTAIKHPQQSEHRDKAITALRAALEQEDDPIVGTKTWFNEEGKIVQQEIKRSEVYKQPAAQEPDYERGFVDGMQEQMKRSVDQAVRAMSGKREWVGLTDEEVNEIYARVELEVHKHWEDGGTTMRFPSTLCKAYEAKLKEKNCELP